MEFVGGQASEKKPVGWVDVLSNDPRLKVAVRFKVPRTPSFPEVFDHLQKATGVRLSFAGQTATSKMYFITAAEFTAPAWKVMERLAATQVTDGKWEKTGDAYVLHGKPKGPESDPVNIAKKAHEEAKAKAAEIAARFPLRTDPKLRAKVSVVEINPKLSDLLERLRQTTGLNFILADNLAGHDPKFGNVPLPDASA